MMIDDLKSGHKSFKRCFFSILFFCLVGALLSCSSKGQDTAPVTGKDEGVPEVSGQPDSPAAETFSLAILPENATRETTIYAKSSGFALSEVSVDWLVNDSIPAGTENTHFKAVRAKKGDRIQARALVNDQRILSNIILIGNTPPVVTNAVFIAEPGDKISVDATASDIDEDDVKISYEWVRNGAPAGNTRQIDVPLKNGDKIRIKITPFDGESYGRPVILYKEIVLSSD